MGYYSFLSPVQKQSLLDWIGAYGEGYGRFLEWCDREGIPEDKRYTKPSYQSWVQRRRRSVKESRTRHHEEVRQQSRMDRDARMVALEETFKRLDAMSHEIEDSDKLTRLEEQKRKTLEAIAKERGEWGVKGAKADDEQRAVDDVIARMAGNVTPIRRVG